MFKKAYILLIIFLNSGSILAQYDDDLPVKKDTDSTKAASPFLKLDLKKNLFPGAEFMLTINPQAIFVEASPFAGLELGRHFYLGAGPHGSFLNVSGNTSSRSAFYYGGNVFGRVLIGDAFFLHAEMRLLNGIVDFNTKNRIWVSSPVYGLGLGLGGDLSSWMLLGYAPNINYAEINPFGHLVYRFGIRF